VKTGAFLSVAYLKRDYLGPAFWHDISPAWFRRSRTGGSSARIVLYTIGVVCLHDTKSARWRYGIPGPPTLLADGLCGTMGLDPV
jgi:hypothetical protein